MKKYVFLCMISFFTLIGCKQQVAIPEGYYAYENSEVEKALEGLSFNPETPEFVPIQVDFIISDQYVVNDTNQEAVDISFYSQENDLLTFQAVEGEFKNLIDGDPIKLEGEISGSYIDNNFAKTLHWSKAGISYKLVYRSGIVKKEEVSNKITKSELVRVAESFQS
ncbi:MULTISPECIES: hypothetical protein [Paraliobacillus]|uniref:hypothetical protein n=1 Tax=Paraliobacillus TaxID=200903 RepID=UPI000DD2C860|nr:MULTISPECIES: hypothetical protein [Paraliobacillus]